MTKKILIFGPQGSGKGTQAEMIAKDFGFVNISMGNLLRDEIRSGSELGLQAEVSMNEGNLVSDELTSQIIKKRLNDSIVKERGFIIDGYPRNFSQQKALEEITDATDVIVIEITDEEAVRRIGGRLITKSGKTFHKIYNPPPKDLDEEVFTRDDDKPEAIRQRLAVYHRETEPVIETYKKRGLVKHIDGMGSIQEVYTLVSQALGG